MIVGVWDTVEASQTAESGDATGGFVGKHSAESLPEHARGLGKMLEAATGVGVDALVLLVLPLQLSSEERLRDFDLLAADNNDTLSTEQLCSYNGCEAATEMATPVNDNLLFEHA